MPREQLISIEDEQRLEWFFSLGQVAFERSTTGSMLENAALYSIAQQYHVPRIPVLGSHGQVIGWESGLEARPTAETRNIGGYIPDRATITRYAIVSRRLKLLERRSPESAMVLEIFYGDLGQHWVQIDQPYGRAGALFHVTVKGKRMVADDLKGPARLLELTASQRMEVFIDTQRKRPKTELGQALAYCAQQADQLAAAARRGWHDVSLGAVAA